jgi:hypothetical protein
MTFPTFHVLQIPMLLITICITNLTPLSWVLLAQPPAVQLLKNFLIFYGTQGFITVFTRALHWSLSWARSIQLTYIIICIYGTIFTPAVLWWSNKSFLSSEGVTTRWRAALPSPTAITLLRCRHLLVGRYARYSCYRKPCLGISGEPRLAPT